MKILLLNNNPVVNKLVTLSAQKTSDELDVVDSLEAIESKNYDLLVVDDTLYSEDVMQELSTKIEFDKSLYICARDAETAEGFTSILKKPFLPTDLVDLFASLANEMDTIDLDEADSSADMSEIDVMDSETDELEELDTIDDDIDDLVDLDSMDDDLGDLEEDLDAIEGLDDLEEELDDSEEISLDDDDLKLDDLEEEISLDDELDLDESNEDEADTILDKEDLQELQDLLEETDEEVDLEKLDETEASDELEEELELEEAEEEDLELEEAEEELELEEAEEELDLESQIENAVGELSDEDLQSEVDEDLLLNIDSLTSRDLKIAIGEEVTEEVDSDSLNESSQGSEVNEIEDFSLESDDVEESLEQIPTDTEITPDNDGVEALKKLLTALSNEDVAASLKGMKININITLGDK